MTHMWNEILQQPTALKKCLSSNEATLNRIVSELKESELEYVVIAARGTSDHAAVYAKYMFEILTGLPVVLAAPSVVTTYKRELSMNHALVIGISQSGAAQDVCEVLAQANKHSAITVGITNFADSPLASTSKYSLLLNAGVEKSVAATKTFTTQLVLLGMLAAKIAGSTEVQSNLEKAPECVEKTISSVKDQVKDVAERYRFINECIVLSRGLNYSIALESALKIEETSYVRAKAFATSDFHHGPMAILEKDMPVIVYAPSGPFENDMREMISLVKQSEADLLVVSDSEEMCRLGNCHILVPKTESEYLTPFVNAAVAQMFACELSIIKGLNPDAPRMLHKVTVTV